MPKSTNDERKDLLESADYHLFTAIDRFFALWVDISAQHPELANHLTDLMCDVERSRFRIQQWYHQCWGGRPGWVIALPEIVHRLREQRADWARDVVSDTGTIQIAGKVKAKNARVIP